jgi:uncharacterized glyoxalase superfamily protein PhnB
MANSVTDVIPLLPYQDIQAAHDFLIRALGFVSGGVEEDGSGQVIHAEVKTGERRIWLHVAADDLSTPQTSGSTTGGIVVHVADVDAHFVRAKAEGATVTSEPQDKEYGQREYGVRDPEGHQWWFATPFASPAG